MPNAFAFLLCFSGQCLTQNDARAEKHELSRAFGAATRVNRLTAHALFPMPPKKKEKKEKEYFCGSGQTFFVGREVKKAFKGFDGKFTAASSTFTHSRAIGSSMRMATPRI